MLNFAQQWQQDISVNSDLYKKLLEVIGKVLSKMVRTSDTALDTEIVRAAPRESGTGRVNSLADIDYFVRQLATSLREALEVFIA